MFEMRWRQSAANSKTLEHSRNKRQTMKYNKKWRSDWVRTATTMVAKASAERDSSELLIASAATELEQVKASLTSAAKAKLTADLARQRRPSQSPRGRVFQHRAVE